jgi:hypothetical protein
MDKAAETCSCGPVVEVVPTLPSSIAVSFFSGPSPDMMSARSKLQRVVLGD